MNRKIALGLFILSLASICYAKETAITQESPELIIGTWSVGGQKFVFKEDGTGEQQFMGAIIDFTYEWDATNSLYFIKVNGGQSGYMMIVSPKKAYFHGSRTFKPAMAKLTMKKKK